MQARLVMEASGDTRLVVLSKHWLDNFCDRHRIAWGRRQRVDAARAAALNEAGLKAHFARIETNLKEMNLLHFWLPERVLNLDESSVVQSDGGSRTLYKVGSPEGRRVVDSNTNTRESFTCATTIRADGLLLPITFILKGQRLPPNWDGMSPQSDRTPYSFRNSEDVCLMNSKGYMTGQAFVEYLQTMLIPWRNKHNPPNEPIFLVMDGVGSHVSDYLALFLMFQNFIVPVLLPPNTSSATQPLDVLGFNLAKKRFRSLVDLEKETRGRKGGRLQRIDFINLVAHAWRQVFEMDGGSVGRKGFEKAGLMPLDASMASEMASPFSEAMQTDKRMERQAVQDRMRPAATDAVKQRLAAMSPEEREQLLLNKLVDCDLTRMEEQQKEATTQASRLERMSSWQAASTILSKENFLIAVEAHEQMKTKREAEKGAARPTGLPRKVQTCTTCHGRRGKGHKSTCTGACPHCGGGPPKTGCPVRSRVHTEAAAPSQDNAAGETDVEDGGPVGPDGEGGGPVEGVPATVEGGDEEPVPASEDDPSPGKRRRTVINYRQLNG